MIPYTLSIPYSCPSGTGYLRVTGKMNRYSGLLIYRPVRKGFGSAGIDLFKLSPGTATPATRPRWAASSGPCHNFILLNHTIKLRRIKTFSSRPINQQPAVTRFMPIRSCASKFSKHLRNVNEHCSNTASRTYPQMATGN